MYLLHRIIRDLVQGVYEGCLQSMGTKQVKENFRFADLCKRSNSEVQKMLYVLCIGGFATLILALIGLNEAHTGVSRLFRELDEERRVAGPDIQMEMNRAA